MHSSDVMSTLPPTQLKDEMLLNRRSNFNLLLYLYLM